MTKAKRGTNPKNVPSLPGTIQSWPSGAYSTTGNSRPEILAYAIKYGNRPTRRLAAKNQASYKHRKLIGVNISPNPMVLKGDAS